jgi:hypothetical protein
MRPINKLETHIQFIFLAILLPPVHPVHGVCAKPDRSHPIILLTSPHPVYHKSYNPGPDIFKARLKQGEAFYPVGPVILSGIFFSFQEQMIEISVSCAGIQNAASIVNASSAVK